MTTLQQDHWVAGGVAPGTADAHLPPSMDRTAPKVRVLPDLRGSLMILWMCTHAGHAQPEPFQQEVMRVIYVVQEGSRWMVKHVLNVKLGSFRTLRGSLRARHAPMVRLRQALVLMNAFSVMKEGSQCMVKHVLNAKLGSISQRRANLLVFLVDPAFQ